LAKKNSATTIARSVSTYRSSDGVKNVIRLSKVEDTPALSCLRREDKTSELLKSCGVLVCHFSTRAGQKSNGTREEQPPRGGTDNARHRIG
jgi:hypothetical protein